MTLAISIPQRHPIYDHVVAELRAGRKQSHWMWFIFPQFDGLSPPDSVYAQILKKYYHDKPDEKSLNIL